MIFSLIATFAAGFFAAGFVLLLQRILRRKFDRWVMPAAAALAMMAYHIWYDYAWIDQQHTHYAPRYVIARTYETRHILQPWTLIKPRIYRFAAVDTQSILMHPELNRYRAVTLLLVTRYVSEPYIVNQIYDCQRPRRMDIASPDNLDTAQYDRAELWESIDENDRLREITCSIRPIDETAT